MRVLLLWGLALLLQAPDLTITLRDAAGAPLAGATVTVQDAGGQVLAQATTDASGMATFARLPVSDVRVQLAGALTDGTALRLMPADAGGIRAYLTSADQLDLIVEGDGTVILDPATLWALEPGGPVTLTTTAFPTAPLPAPSPMGTVGARATLVAPPATGAPAGIAAPPVPTPHLAVVETPAAGARWLPAGLLGALLLVLGVSLLALRRGRGR